MPSFSTLWLLNPPLVSMPGLALVGARAAHDVPPALADGVLHADDLRAERGEEPGGARAGELAAEVADADV